MRSFVNRLDDSWRDITSIIVYGFGRQGRGYITELAKSFQVVMIIDNGIENVKDYEGIPIVTLKQYVQSGLMEKIIITAAGGHISRLSRVCCEKESEKTRIS